MKSCCVLSSQIYTNVDEDACAAVGNRNYTVAVQSALNSVAHCPHLNDLVAGVPRKARYAICKTGSAVDGPN
jgi:hypothetical protein